MLLTVLLLALILLILVYIYSIWTFDHWRKKGVAYLKPQPFFGNIFQAFIFKKSLLDTINDFYRRGSGHPVIGYFQFRLPALLIRDPELVKTILDTNYDCYSEYHCVDSELDPLLSRIPEFLRGDAWKAVRALLSPAFTRSKVKNMFPLMAVECREMVGFLEKEAFKFRPGGLPVKDFTSKFTTDVVVRCGFGVFGNSFTETQAVMRKMGEDITVGGLFTALKYMLHFLLPDIRKYFKFRFQNSNVQNIFRKIIRELVLYRENNKVFRNDFLQMLIHIKKLRYEAKGKNLIRVAGIDIEYTDEDIVAHALTMFYNGYEYPSFLLSCALYQLAMNPAVQNKLRAEMEEVLMSYSGGLTYESVEEMPYLDMVICGMRYAQAELKAGLVAIVSHFEIRPTSKTPQVIAIDPFIFPFDFKGGLFLDFVRRL